MFVKSPSSFLARPYEFPKTPRQEFLKKHMPNLLNVAMSTFLANGENGAHF